MTTRTEQREESRHVTELRLAQLKMMEGYVAKVIAGELPAITHYEEFVEAMANYAGPLIRSGELPRITQLPGDVILLKYFHTAMRGCGLRAKRGSVPRRHELLRESDVR